MLELLDDMAPSSLGMRRGAYRDKIIRLLEVLTCEVVQVDGAIYCRRLFQAAGQVLADVAVLVRGLSSQWGLGYVGAVNVMVVGILDCLLPVPFLMPSIRIDIAKKQVDVSARVWAMPGSYPEIVTPLPQGVAGWRILLRNDIKAQPVRKVWCGDVRASSPDSDWPRKARFHVRSFTDDIRLVQIIVYRVVVSMWKQLGVDVINGVVVTQPVVSDMVTGTSSDLQQGELCEVHRRLMHNRRVMFGRLQEEKAFHEQAKRKLEKAMSDLRS